MLRRNILIFHLAALGDFVLTWPLALALSRIYPQSRIIYVTHGEKAKLAEKVLGVESSDIESGWASLFTDRELPDKPRRLLEGASSIFTFLGKNPAWTANTQRLNPQAKLISLEGKPPETFTGHACDWLVEQLKPHQVEQTALQQILRSVADRGIGFRRSGGSDVIIHPGSGGTGKCWPLENFIELAKRLRNAGRSVRFIIGEVERDKWSREDLEMLSTTADLRQPATYLELLNELGTAGMFIGNDSGPGHLAGIIGIPTISIFTSTSEAKWRPVGPQVRALQSASIDEVADAAESL